MSREKIWTIQSRHDPDAGRNASFNICVFASKKIILTKKSFQAFKVLITCVATAIKRSVTFIVFLNQPSHLLADWVYTLKSSAPPSRLFYAYERLVVSQIAFFL